MRTDSLYYNALLAEACYANFRNIDLTDRNQVQIALQRIGTDVGDPDDPEKGLSETQAEIFTDNWEVIHPSITENG